MESGEDIKSRCAGTKHMAASVVRVCVCAQSGREECFVAAVVALSYEGIKRNSRKHFNGLVKFSLVSVLFFPRFHLDATHATRNHNAIYNSDNAHEMASRVQPNMKHDEFM
jgi:hypothetical protein